MDLTPAAAANTEPLLPREHIFYVNFYRIEVAWESSRRHLIHRYTCAAMNLPHAAHRGGFVGTLWHHIRYGLRTLARSPGFLAVAVFTLALGIGAGVAGTYALTGLLGSLLFGVEATDPVTFISVNVVTGVMAMSACMVPARGATRVDPRVALRYQ